MKRFLHRNWLFVVLCVAGASAVAYHLMQPRPAATEAAVAAPAVATAKTRVGIFLQRITVQGRVGSPLGDITKLSFAEAGTLARIDVHLGDRIRSGDSLAVIDQRSLMTARDQAHAAVAAAGALTSVYAKQRLAAQQLQTQQHGISTTFSDTVAAQSQAQQAASKTATDAATLDRQQRLFAAGVVARKDLRAAQDQLAADRSDEQAAAARLAAAKQTARLSAATAHTDLTVARGDVATLQAQRTAAEAQEVGAQIALDRATLRSPVDGIVLAVDKHLGEAVDTTSPVIEIGSSRATNVTLSVPVDQAIKMHPGDTVELHGSSGVRANGYVSQVLPVVDPSTQAATVTVAATIPHAVPGDVVSGNITIARIRGIVVPNSAIVQDPQTGQDSVFVRTENPKADASPFEQRNVHVAASDEQQAVITGGVSSGETIATSAAYTLLAPNGG